MADLGGGGEGEGRMANFQQFNKTALKISANLAFNFCNHFLFDIQPAAIFRSHFPDFALKICLY